MFCKTCERLTAANALQALQQADFALPQPLATALVKASVSLPRPLTHLAACFNHYGLSVASLLTTSKSYGIAHPAPYQGLLENACRGLELQQSLPYFADAVDRWGCVHHLPMLCVTVAKMHLPLLGTYSTITI